VVKISVQINTIVGALNGSQGKMYYDSLITQSIGLAQTVTSGQNLTQGQINGLVGSVAQIGSVNGGKRINSATLGLIAQSLGLTSTISTGKKVTQGQVSALVNSSIQTAILAEVRIKWRRQRNRSTDLVV
jgi:hypothetical protein